MKNQAKALLFAATVSCVPSIVHATTGIYLTGYGAKEQGMGGAGIAVAQSAMSAAANPAGMAFLGDRLDAGVGALLGDSNTKVYGREFRMDSVVVPFLEVGYSHAVNQNISVGFSNWASGGGTKYGSPFGGIPGNSATDSQGVFLHFAPTMTYKIAERQALAVSLVASLATLRIDGIEAQSGQPNRGREWEPGLGIKFGWLGKFSDEFSFGAFYASKIYYKKFKEYSQLLPDGGDLDEPAHWGVGLAFKPTSNLQIAIDYLRFDYAKTKGFGNRLNFSVPLGNTDGSGFGLRDVSVLPVGVSYELSSRWTIRGGMALGQSPITSDNTAFTFLLPVTPDKTFTIGATAHLASGSDISFVYALTPRKRIDGTGASTGVNPEAGASYIGVGFSKKF
ncbi:outer membrane protein transport protein [Duganella sp. LX20W]|uniref:Outer membrane protein transport protein n=1 Tax=Rugamonas brunnea TaxID=2758569 RepID=A0A7W2EPI4_9BURK|nr:outer membrane protein transport protein [Rugamonas brunnea]MBA5636064.1 outer membrane protein transport protein [Rugamonas brunnea]